MKYEFRWLKGEIKGGCIEVVRTSRRWPRFWLRRRERTEMTCHFGYSGSAADMNDRAVEVLTESGGSIKQRIELRYRNQVSVEGTVLHHVIAWLREQQTVKGVVWEEVPEVRELPEARLLRDGERT